MRTHFAVMAPRTLGILAAPLLLFQRARDAAARRRRMGGTSCPRALGSGEAWSGPAPRREVAPPGGPVVMAVPGSTSRYAGETIECRGLAVERRRRFAAWRARIHLADQRSGEPDPAGRESA